MSAGYGGVGRCLSCERIFDLEDDTQEEECPGCGATFPTEELRHFQTINFELEEV